jgi:hypothetical protein
MKILGILLIAGAATGCRSYVTLSDVAAARGEHDDVVVSFTADRDVAQAAQFVHARLWVPAQLDAARDGADEALALGHSLIDRVRLTRVAERARPEGTLYVYRASFPLRGERVVEHRVWFSTSRQSFPYDLTTPGLHVLEFEVSGANCGGPGGFYGDRIQIPLRVPP